MAHTFEFVFHFVICGTVNQMIIIIINTIEGEFVAKNQAKKVHDIMQGYKINRRTLTIMYNLKETEGKDLERKSGVEGAYSHFSNLVPSLNSFDKQVSK